MFEFLFRPLRQAVLGKGIGPLLAALIPAAASLFGGLLTKSKQPDITRFPEFNQLRSLIDMQQQQMMNAQPIQNGLLQAWLQRIPRSVQQSTDLGNFTGLNTPPKNTPQFTQGAGGRAITRRYRSLEG